MYVFLLSILVIVSILLIAAILLQSGKGGGLAATFGGSSSQADAIFGTRQAGNLLTQSSWWLGGAFLVLSLGLSLVSARGRTPTSVLDKSFGAPKPAAPAAAPGGAPATGGAPAAGVPLAPVAPAGGESKAPATKSP
ncbi:MAG: preprotein translocase subunit SecG [Gemmatimonadota bacterium]|jgi:preprotein translocase subunit SecG|nr:preprotein translocase subunit SecG [Gemmatimonadota bacterium]